MEKEDKTQSEEEIGKVKHFFSKVSAAGIEITSGSLSIGETIHIKGHTTDLTQTIGSMQVDNEPVDTAKTGDLVGIRMDDMVRENDIVYKVLG